MKNIDILDNMVETLSVVFRGIFLETGLKLRLTQQLSIILFLISANKGRGMLEQVSTGEGKSLIVVALAIAKYMSGRQVDIITSSSVLAKRDAEDYSEVYSLFGASVSHNCCENVDDRKEAYKSSIVYGEIGTFQRDILLDEFYDENILGDRKSDNVIIDEVDSMLLDKGQNVLYLSHSIPGMDTLEPLYVHIWNFVHAKDLFGTDEDIESVYQCAMNAMYGTIQINDLRMSFSRESTLTPSQIQYLWQYLIDEKVIDKAGRILKKTAIINDEFIVLCPDGNLSKTQYIIACTLKDCLRRGSAFNIPNYLEDFVNRHLKTLIKNAFKARFLNEGEHYIIDVDKSTMFQERSCNVIIMDTDTGTEQYNSQWNNGLHQFLQLKHGCRISFESLKAVFMSNITFFKKYEPNIYGLTGTLGSERERELLKDLYSIEYMTIPTFRSSKFIEENAIICGTKDEWLKNILDCVRTVSECRPVLIISETIREVEQIEKEFTRNTSIVPHVYKHSHQDMDIFKDNSIPKRCVILATNLAGRGTDIKIDEKADASGGLFVCLTYLPSNIRIEQQAFGRSARKGQNGSGKLIILHTDCDSDHTMDAVKCSIKKTERNLHEQRRISKIKCHYDRKIKIEEQLFMKFQGHFRDLKKIEEKKKLDKMKMSLIRQSLLDRWAIWLDSVEESINEGKDVKGKFYDFCKMIDVSSVNLKKVTTYRDLIEHPANCIKLGKILVQDGNFEEAESIFDKVIQSEPQFSEAAYYYKAHCIIKRTNLRTSVQKCTFKNYLHKAKVMIATRIDQLQNYVIMVNVLSDQYTKSQDSFLFADDYRIQKEGVISVYQSFLQSINDACGHEITLDMIEDISTDPFQATVIYQDLLNNDILVGPTVDCEYSTRLHQLDEEYLLYSHEITDTLKALSSRVSVRAKDFANILPSREEYWEVLLHAGLLTDEEEYVFVNKDKLKEVHMNRAVSKKILDLLSHVTDVSKKHGKDDIQPKEVWLYEHSGDIKNAIQKEDRDGKEVIQVRRSEFEAHLGSIKLWKVLKRKGIILRNKKAVLNPRIDPALVTLQKYDELPTSAFAVINGVKTGECEAIFRCLIKEGIISSSKSTKLLQQNFGNINLGPYRRFQTEIINILQKNFQYRLALIKFQSENTINFPVRPHKNLFNDLIKLRLIKPVMVNGNVNEDKMTKILNELYGEDRSWMNTSVEYVLHESNVLRNMKEEACLPTFNRKDLEPICFSHGISVEKLMIVMTGMGWIRRPTCIYNQDDATCSHAVYKITHKDSIVNNMYQSEYKSIGIYLQYLLQSKITCKEFKTSIVNKLIFWKIGLNKYDKIDSNLVDLIDSLNNETQVAMAEELMTFSLNGLDHIISLCEVKWSWQCIGKIAAIIAIGLAQIIAGALLEIVTAGVFTHVASGLIGEGIGDIMFAIECALSGYCTFTSYLKNKAVSLAFTIMTGGIGMWFSRGAKFSRYSYKIGGELLPNLTGKQLVKQVGRRAIAREVTKRVAKKMVEAVAYGVASAGVDYAIDQLIRKQLQTMCDSIVADIKNKIESKNLISLAHELRLKVGSERAMSIIQEINQGVLDSCTQEWDEIYGALSKMVSKVSSGFGSATKKLQRSSDNRAKILSKISKAMSYGVQVANVGNSSYQLMKITNIMLKNIEQKIQEKIQNQHTTFGQNVIKSDEKQDFEHKIVDEWKQVIGQKLQDKLTTGLVKPAAQYCTSSAVNYAGQCVKSSFSWCRNAIHNQQFIKLQKKYGKDGKNAETENGTDIQSVNSVMNDISDDYNRELTKLLMKTKSPTLFASIIKEGVPLGVQSAQAVSEICGRTIEIRVHGGEGIVMPEKFEPSSGHPIGESIVLDFHVGENGIGHFSSSVDLSAGDIEGSKLQSVRFDCLLEAVQQQSDNNIDRDKIANKIETDPVIRSRIERGIHAHFIQKGGVGGLCPTERQIQNMRLRKNQSGLYKNCSLHEFCQRQYTNLWRKLSESVPDSHLKLDDGTLEPYNFHDLFALARVDQRYVVFCDDSGAVRGHSGTFDTDKDMTKGQTSYHDEIHKAMYDANRSTSAQEGIVNVLKKHIELTGEASARLSNSPFDGEYDKKLTIRLTEHNLCDPEQRTEYCRGLNRERYKLACVMEKLQGSDPKFANVNTAEIKRQIGNQLGADHTFIRGIEDKVKSAGSIKELGKIMMAPANAKNDVGGNLLLSKNHIDTRKNNMGRAVAAREKGK